MHVERTPTAGRATPSTEVDSELLTSIARGGLLICEAELRYQLARRGHDMASLPTVLAGREERGLIESAVHYRLTPAGAQLVPADERPAPLAISSIPWAAPPLSAAPKTRARPSPPPTASRPVGRSSRAVRPRRKTGATMT
jgi:hypothetical protein